MCFYVNVSLDMLKKFVFTHPDIILVDTFITSFIK